MNSNRIQLLLAASAPAIFLLLWSGGFTVAKIGLLYADPITLLAVRYGSVVLLLIPLCVIFRPAMPTTFTTWGHLILVGFLIQCVYFGAAYIAFGLGASAGAVALITSLQPILVALAMTAKSRESVSTKNWLGLTLGLTGAVIVIVENFSVEVTSVTALLFSVAALLAITLATILEKSFGVSHHPLTSNLVQYIVGFMGTLPVAWALEPMNISWTLPFGLSLAYLVIGNSLLAISLLLMMIRNGDATRVSALFYLVPPVSGVIAWMALDERMGPVAWFGMAIAAAGVWLATRKASAPKNH